MCSIWTTCCGRQGGAGRIRLPRSFKIDRPRSFLQVPAKWTSRRYRDSSKNITPCAKSKPRRSGRTRPIDKFYPRGTIRGNVRSLLLHFSIFHFQRNVADWGFLERGGCLQLSFMALPHPVQNGRQWFGITFAFLDCFPKPQDWILGIIGYGRWCFSSYLAVLIYHFSCVRAGGELCSFLVFSRRLFCMRSAGMSGCAF